MSAAVYVQTNNATENEVIVFSRADDGALAPVGRYSTGGRGTGVPHLASAGSVVLGDDDRWLLVVNAGSDELSLFAVQPDGLRLADRVRSGGSGPTSVAVSGALVYVLNNGTPNISGFNLTDGKLTALAGSARPLSGADADPAQISFTPGGAALIATERGTNTISSYVIDQRGYAQGPATIKSSGQTPYGFGLTKDGSLIVSEAFGSAMDYQAHAAFAAGSHQQAANLTVRALAAYQHIGYQEGIASAGALAASLAALTSQHENADHLLAQAYDACQRMGHPGGTATVL